jgi:SAM-dependent methyltransferase
MSAGTIVYSHKLQLSEGDFVSALADYRGRWPLDGYHTYRSRFVETFRLLRKVYSNGPVLDVGGWPGDMSCILSSMGMKVTLLDKVVSRPIRKAHDSASGRWVLDGSTTLEHRCAEYGVSTLECDIEREPIPLPEQAVDCIIFTEVIEHLRVGLLHALRELRRVLKPGGKLILSTPNLLSLQNRISFLLGRMDYDTLEKPFDALAAEERIGHGGHFRVFSLPELMHLLNETGFEVTERQYHNLHPCETNQLGFGLYGCRVRVKDWLARTIKPLGNTIFLVAQRSAQ